MKLIAALVMLLALSACSLPVFFRVPIVQGNVVTAEQVAKLHKGMTKKQVTYVLGSPLVKSPFEDNRWDYVFYYRNPRAHVRESQLKLYFTNGHLASIKGDEEYTVQALKNNENSSSEASHALPGEAAAMSAPSNTPSGHPQNGDQSEVEVPKTNTGAPSSPGAQTPNTGGTPPQTGPSLPGNPR